MTYYEKGINMGNNLVLMQLAAKRKHFKHGIYYAKEIALVASNPDTFENGAPFTYGLITDSYKLNYLANHVALQENDVVLETYSPLNWDIKGKVKLDTGRLLQVKTITPTEEVISPMSIVKRYTITLG